MSEIFKIVLTSSLTIIGGIIIYAFTQIASKFFIEPIHEQKKVIGEILSATLYYPVLFNMPNASIDKNESIQKILILSKELMYKTQLIPYYSLFEKISIVLPMKNITETWEALHSFIALLSSPSPDIKKLMEISSKIVIGLNIKFYN